MGSPNCTYMALRGFARASLEEAEAEFLVCPLGAHDSQPQCLELKALYPQMVNFFKGSSVKQLSSSMAAVPLCLAAFRSVANMGPRFLEIIPSFWSIPHESHATKPHTAMAPAPCKIPFYPSRMRHQKDVGFPTRGSSRRHSTRSLWASGLRQLDFFLSAAQLGSSNGALTTSLSYWGWH